MENSSFRVTIIIVTYNSAGVIDQCLRSLGERAEHEVLVIDNQSSDNTVASVQEFFPWVRVIENSENAGFSSAVNQAAESAQGRHLFLLNPDALVTSSVVSGLADLLDDDESIGAAAPLVTTEADDLRVITAGHAPTTWRMLLHETGMSRFGTVSRRLEGHYLFRSSFAESPRDVDWSSGGCILVRGTTWRDEGGLSDRWFMYAEDVELCLRIRSRGLRVVVAPAYQALHAVGGSSAGVDGRANPAWIVNLFDLYTWRMARSNADPLLWKAVVLAGFAARWLVFRVRESTIRASGARAQRRRYEIYFRALAAARPSDVRDGLAPWSKSRS